MPRVVRYVCSMLIFLKNKTKTKTKFEEKKQKQKFFVNLNFARIFTKRSPDEELGKLDIQFT